MLRIRQGQRKNYEVWAVARSNARIRLADAVPKYDRFRVWHEMEDLIAEQVAGCAWDHRRNLPRNFA